MTKNTTDEQMKHYNKIIEQFDSVHMPAKQREIIMTEIEQLISSREKLARIDELRGAARHADRMYPECDNVLDHIENRITTLRKELDGGSDET